MSFPGERGPRKNTLPETGQVIGQAGAEYTNEGPGNSDGHKSFLSKPLREFYTLKNTKNIHNELIPRNIIENIPDKIDLFRPTGTGESDILREFMTRYTTENPRSPIIISYESDSLPQWGEEGHMSDRITDLMATIRDQGRTSPVDETSDGTPGLRHSQIKGEIYNWIQYQDRTPSAAIDNGHEEIHRWFTEQIQTPVEPPPAASSTIRELREYLLGVGDLAGDAGTESPVQPQISPATLPVEVTHDATMEEIRRRAAEQAEGALREESASLYPENPDSSTTFRVTSPAPETYTNDEGRLVYRDGNGDEFYATGRGL